MTKHVVILGKVNGFHTDDIIFDMGNINGFGKNRIERIAGLIDHINNGGVEGNPVFVNGEKLEVSELQKLAQCSSIIINNTATGVYKAEMLEKLGWQIKKNYRKVKVRTIIALSLMLTITSVIYNYDRWLGIALLIMFGQMFLRRLIRF
ncbi:MAG: hypothetical protein B6242_06260 [Anaerolineaceae bacterium 4572_78]|nr:MAG: hypothetical protein B6242_06260 [Anaerolineaceae bacterium 4572_78]